MIQAWVDYCFGWFFAWRARAPERKRIREFRRGYEWAQERFKHGESWQTLSLWCDDQFEKTQFDYGVEAAIRIRQGLERRSTVS